ncbi:MAG: hypothetical protein ABSA79_05945, partial [Candidatus Bathyarchaeia archaeon]
TALPSSFFLIIHFLSFSRSLSNQALPHFRENVAYFKDRTMVDKHEKAFMLNKMTEKQGKK